MRNLTQDNITQAVIARFADTPDPRLKQIVTSLVQHLHAFARDVKLTEDEWFQGIQFLTRTGHISDDKRQEFILLSDVLGLSMLTVAMNNEKPAGATEATVFGPFFVEGAPAYEHGDDIANGAVGIPCKVRGRIRDLDGKPVPAPASRSGRPTPRACTTCSAKTPATRPAAAWSRARRASTTSSPSWPRPTRSPTTARWATC
jgi:hydroxyquinol 1,2-dioxygenase